MRPQKVLVIDAHPDGAHGHFIHALAQAYLAGAADRQTRLIKLSELDFPILRDPAEWTNGKAPQAIVAAQADIAWAEHVVLLYPLWLGEMPALLKAFLEQVMRPDFAFRYVDGGFPLKLLKGRSARIVVTMGMPALLYSMFYGAHSLKALKRNILHFVGIRPVALTVIGSVEDSDRHRHKWIERMKAFGRAGK